MKEEEINPKCIDYDYENQDEPVEFNISALINRRDIFKASVDIIKEELDSGNEKLINVLLIQLLKDLDDEDKKDLLESIIGSIAIADEFALFAKAIREYAEEQESDWEDSTLKHILIAEAEKLS